MTDWPLTYPEGIAVRCKFQSLIRKRHMHTHWHHGHKYLYEPRWRTTTQWIESGCPPFSQHTPTEMHVSSCHRIDPFIVLDQGTGLRTRAEDPKGIKEDLTTP